MLWGDAVVGKSRFAGKGKGTARFSTIKVEEPPLSVVWCDVMFRVIVWRQV